MKSAANDPKYARYLGARYIFSAAEYGWTDVLFGKKSMLR